MNSIIRSSLWAVALGAFSIGCGAAPDGSFNEEVDSADPALMRQDDVEGSADAEAAEVVAQRAASCTATSDGGKWCCAPDANGTLKCWKVPPPPPPDTIATRAVLTAKALKP